MPVSAMRWLRGLSRFKIRVQAEISRGARSVGGSVSSARGRSSGCGLAADGLRDRAGRDDPGRHGRRGGRRELHEGLLSGPGIGRTDGLTWGRRTADAAHRRRRPTALSVGDPLLDSRRRRDRQDHERLTARRSGAGLWSSEVTTSAIPPLISPDPEKCAGSCAERTQPCTFRDWGGQAAGAGERVRRIATTSGFWRMPISSGEPSMIDASPAGDVPASAAVRSQPIASA